MSKRTVFTTITPLPEGITRETVLETLQSHVEMIDLNPLVVERHLRGPPANATPEEVNCTWYSLTDRISYAPGVKGTVTYNACFHDLADGVQTHVFAPLGLDIKEKWTLGGAYPGEGGTPRELGLNIPQEGLYLREDCDMRCNILMTSFVRKTLQKAHAVLVERLMLKTSSAENDMTDRRFSISQSSTTSSPSSIYSDSQSAFSSPGFPSYDARSFDSGTSTLFTTPQTAPEPQLEKEEPQPSPPPKIVEVAPTPTSPTAPPLPSRPIAAAPPKPAAKPPRQSPEIPKYNPAKYAAYQPPSAPPKHAFVAYQPPVHQPKQTYTAYRQPAIAQLERDALGIHPALRPRSRSNSPSRAPEIPDFPLELPG